MIPNICSYSDTPALRVRASICAQHASKSSLLYLHLTVAIVLIIFFSRFGPRLQNRRLKRRYFELGISLKEERFLCSTLKLPPSAGIIKLLLQISLKNSTAIHLGLAFYIILVQDHPVDFLRLVTHRDNLRGKGPLAPATITTAQIYTPEITL